MDKVKVSRPRFDLDVVGENTTSFLYLDTYKDLIESAIWDQANQKRYVRLITTQTIPEEVLFSLSYSTRNILHVRVNMLNLKGSLEWLCKLSSRARNCGLFLVVTLDMIIPGVVKLPKILSVLSVLNFNRNVHFSLRFCEFIPSKVENSKYLNMNGLLVPSRYFFKEENYYTPTSSVKEQILELVTCYMSYPKISVSEYTHLTWSGEKGGELYAKEN